MKKAFYAAPGVLLLFFLLFVGTIPFLVSVLIRIVIRRQWIACLLAFGLTAAVTLYSSAYPETFRFGTTNLRIHDSVRIMGKDSLPASITVNLVYAWLGLLIGTAARTGYREGQSNKPLHPTAGNAPV
jgi:predicted histidine transporter YuiF (NhaC family)